MKVRLIGGLLVIAVLGALAYLTELPPAPLAPESVQLVPSSTDNSFKDLKIN